MKRKKGFCSFCGQPIIQKEDDKRIRDYCPVCNTYFYENPLPVASSIVLNEKREVLLVKRKNEPYKDMWCLPIGFAESGEEITQAALRELEEEAGVNGEIIRLIDVDTVDNYFYGSLAIVTYEVRITGGAIAPGDDASEAEYYKLSNLPKLAWASNEKAIKIFIELYKDSWAMIDSFKNLFPEVNSDNIKIAATNEQHQFLSTVLIKILSNDYKEITGIWEHEIKEKIPKLNRFIDILIETNNEILRIVQKYLIDEHTQADFNGFIMRGREIRKQMIPLPELLMALALSRKSIWKSVIKKNILFSPLEVYSILEFNNRIIFIYDKIIFNITSGYLE